jgi:NADP-dependent 3-hydroxy acid dehydrogenase YdfG
MAKLDGKVAVITVGSSGIGLATNFLFEKRAAVLRLNFPL